MVSTHSGTWQKILVKELSRSDHPIYRLATFGIIVGVLVAQASSFDKEWFVVLAAGLPELIRWITAKKE